MPGFENECILREFGVGARSLYFLVDIGAAGGDPLAQFFRRMARGKCALAAWCSAEAASVDRERLGLAGFEVFHYESPDFGRLLLAGGRRCIDIMVMDLAAPLLLAHALDEGAQRLDPPLRHSAAAPGGAPRRGRSRSRA